MSIAPYVMAQCSFEVSMAPRQAAMASLEVARWAFASRPIIAWLLGARHAGGELIDWDWKPDGKDLVVKVALNEDSTIELVAWDDSWTEEECYGWVVLVDGEECARGETDSQAEAQDILEIVGPSVVEAVSALDCAKEQVLAACGSWFGGGI